MEKISFYVNKELNSTIFTIEKDAVYANMRDGIEEFYRGEFTKYMLLDFSNHEKPLSSEEIMLTGQQMMRLGKLRKGGFDLIVVPDLLQYGLGRMYAAYVETLDPAALQTKIFRSKEAAIQWIKDNEIAEKFKANNAQL